MGDAAAGVHVSPVDVALLLLAGLSAGVMNAVVGAGTLVTFPTLLFLGYPPVIANVSNTVGLVPGAVMATIGYRGTLQGRGPVIRRLVIAAIIGGITGSALLVLLPGRAFDAVVPWLLLLSALLAAIQPRIAAAVELRRVTQRRQEAAGRDGMTDTDGSQKLAQRVGSGLFLSIAVTGVYGGYFGAAQGVILLVILALAYGGPINALNGVKNILGGTANGVAALFFIATTEVDWAVAGIIAVGATIGGGIGGRYGRRLPSSALRVLLVGIAVVAAAVRFIG